MFSWGPLKPSAIVAAMRLLSESNDERAVRERANFRRQDAQPQTTEATSKEA